MILQSYLMSIKPLGRRVRAEPEGLYRYGVYVWAK
jgi:hypothetical protein